jgi:hypothetical protein
MLDTDEVMDAELFTDWFRHSGEPQGLDVMDFAANVYTTSRFELIVNDTFCVAMMARDSVLTRGYVLHSRDR